MGQSASVLEAVVADASALIHSDRLRTAVYASVMRTTLTDRTAVS
jgi:hypothetical protein